MKAYKDKQGRIRLFRPEMNMARMQKSTGRIGLPVSKLTLSLIHTRIIHFFFFLMR